MKDCDNCGTMNYDDQFRCYLCDEPLDTPDNVRDCLISCGVALTITVGGLLVYLAWF